MRNPLKVAVIDDDNVAANSLSVLLADARMEPKVVEQRFTGLSAAADSICAVADAAVCDHRLHYGGYATFLGAELVAHLYTRKFPAVLVSQYSDIDYDVSIRKFRKHIPVMLSRDQADGNALQQGLTTCQAELDHGCPASRKAWRSLIQINSKDTEGTESVVDVVIPAWNPRTAVRFPASLLPEDIRSEVDHAEADALDMYLFAYVNIGADNQHDLFFYGFERAPIAEASDGLN